jgi:hypothetical protein
MPNNFDFIFGSTTNGGTVVASDGPTFIVLNLSLEFGTVSFDKERSNVSAEEAASVVLEAARFIRRENVWAELDRAHQV